MTPDTIQIDVKVQHLPQQSQPDKQQFAFAYQITLTNNGDRSVQLISRHWIITDATEDRQEVKGLGVIGEQPHIAPGESYQYTSGAVLNTDTGTMEGIYHMLCDDEFTTFDVPIPLFLLAVPGAVH